jgi:hypothetical protein
MIIYKYDLGLCIKEILVKESNRTIKSFLFYRDLTAAPAI